MKARKVYAGLLSLIMVLSTTFSTNPMLVRAEGTPGIIDVSISGSGEVQFEFYENEEGTTPCPSDNMINVTSDGNVTIPSGEHGAKSVIVKAWGLGGYRGNSASGDFDNDIFRPEGKLFGISSDNSYSLSADFVFSGETPPPTPPSDNNKGDIVIHVENLLGESKVSYKIGDGPWIDFTNNMTLRKSVELESTADDTTIYFKATPAEGNQILDTHDNQNWININGSQTNIDTSALTAGTVNITYNSSNTYEVRVKFDNLGTPPSDGEHDPISFPDNINVTVSGKEAGVDKGWDVVEVLNINQRNFVSESEGVKTFAGYGSANSDKTNVITLVAPYTFDISKVTINGSDMSPSSTNEEDGSSNYEVAGADSYTIYVETSRSTKRTIVWAYDDSFGPDAKVENGTVEFVSGGTGHDGFFTAEIGDEITVKLIPAYGYQVVGAKINDEVDLSAGDDENVNIFTFEMPSTDVHFKGIFTATEDIVDNAASAVSAASFTGDKVAPNGGTAKMTISNATPADISGVDGVDSSKAVQAVDITMDQLFYKNSADDVWSANKQDLESAATVSLTVSQDATGYAVIRTHGETVEEIPAVYNSESKTITFNSDKYSTYTLVPLAENSTVSITDVNKDSYYSADPEGEMVCEISGTSEVKVFDTIFVPADYHFVINDVNVVANSITIAAGGSLEILGSGSFTVATINATAATESTPGSFMMLQKNSNKPSCVAGLFDITEGAVDITDDPNWEWFTFEYLSDENITGWCTQPGGEPEYSVFLEGYDPTRITVNVSLSTDGGASYGESVAVEVENFDSFGIGAINDIPEGVTNVKITVTANAESRKRIYYAFSGHPDDEKSVMDDRYGKLSHEAVFNHTLDGEASGFIPHEVHVIIGNEKEGSFHTRDLIQAELYAYSDLNNDSNIDETDMKIGLATELCSRFFWDEGGIIDDGVFDIYKPLDLFDPSDAANSRIEVTSAGTITAKDKDGSDVSMNRFSYTINLGKTSEGTPVIANGYVYGLTDYNQILVYTGNAYFVRSTSDEVKFYEDEAHPENDDVAIAIKAAFNPNDIRIGGNGASQGAETINPEGDEVYCTYLSNEMGRPSGGRFVDYYNRYYTSYTRLNGYTGCCKLRIVNPTQTYVVVNAEGETKDVYGINSNQVDRVSQTGAGKETEVFVGNSAIHIEAVNDDIANVVSISKVELKDSSMADGVVIAKVADDDFRVEFKSNFYDSVPLVITYANGSKKELTINRIGLVITSMYLMDNSSTFNFFHGGEVGTASCSYDYSAGQTVIVYATYYHPTVDVTGGDNNLSLFVTNDDGTTQIINKTAYTPASGGSVAMTDFVIAFRQGREILPDGNFGGNIDPSMQGLHAIVLNSGFDNNTSFSGTQVGSGKGVYWDGRIEWNY